MANEEYKFPHEETEASEKEADKEDGFSIQIVDDTPEQDRGRKPLPKDIVDELDNDDLEEYSEKVKKRLGQMKKVWHDERRAKESAAREREEALRFAQIQAEENKRLKQRLGVGEKLYIEEIKKSANSELEAAKSEVEEAFESGDGKKIADAQVKLNKIQLTIHDYEKYKPSLQDEDNEVQQPQQTRTAPQVDSKAEAWKTRNQWFGADEEMTALALGLHEKLHRSGVEIGSDDYYQKIDSTMRKRFPENFGDERNADANEKTASRTRPATVVAPASRSSAPRQVRLTASAVALAKRLGLTPEQYAREMIRLENNNG
jgi:hypothetical protein